MYSPNYRLDTPPPSSSFRPRPWSPDPADHLPSLRTPGTPVRSPADDTDRWTSAAYQHRRREASDPSIEALDLADYAHILNPHTLPFAHQTYGTSYPAYDDYPSTPPSARPFSVASRASLQPPSLVSSRGTRSSQSHSTSFRRHADSRHFSLPAPLPVHAHAQPSIAFQSDVAPSQYGPPHSLDAISSRQGGPGSDIDIAQFPAWSRGWYTKDNKLVNTDTRSEASRAPFFDPSYHANTFAENQYDPYAATNSASSRDLVPWSDNDIPDYGIPLDAEIKEERMRMLVHEFGDKQATEAKDDEPVGSVDDKGRLMTQGPRKRVAVRAVETLLALGTACSAIYAALWIKPPHPPPPQSKPQTFALYALSVLTIMACLYLFLLRPCCCGGRRKERGLTSYTPGGLTVLPIQGLPGDKQNAKKGKKGMQERGGVQVNLIVDPAILSPGHHRDDDEGTAIPDDYPSSLGQSNASRRPKRRSVFEGLAMEERWKAARKELKWLLFFDIACLALWSVEFVWILIKEKCPPGGFDGWCNAYNVASAGACLLGFAFGISVFFGVKDLHQSRLSPRTRT
ncbi:hypothetical protein BC834DRAFT_854476 [Gloeopeniophorella convolvens]|nr:hypothetical protein BC834DRAFT_854476 [Gloeopeniophorella convolvens]